LGCFVDLLCREEKFMNPNLRRMTPSKELITHLKILTGNFNEV